MTCTPDDLPESITLQCAVDVDDAGCPVVVLINTFDPSTLEWTQIINPSPSGATIPEDCATGTFCESEVIFDSGQLDCDCGTSKPQIRAVLRSGTVNGTAGWHISFFTTVEHTSDHDDGCDDDGYICYYKWHDEPLGSTLAGVVSATIDDRDGELCACSLLEFDVPIDITLTVS